MRASNVGPIILFVTLAACKHDDGESVGTTTVRSGSTSGPKVTDVRTDASDDRASRLTSAVCTRERQCAEQRGGRSSGDCAGEVLSTSTLLVQNLGCDASTARPGFEACLAAIRTEDCGTSGAFSADLPQCRMSQICAAGR